MAQQEEIVLWLDRRWKKAIERHLKDETLQEHLENVLDELCNRLPAHEYERISRAIQAEAAAQRAEEEAARTYAAYHVVENGQEWYFKTTPGEELLDVCKKLRSYITTDESAAPDLFIKMFAGAQPITAEEYDALTVLRMQNTGKNRGVFDLDFDKGYAMYAMAQKPFSQIDGIEICPHLAETALHNLSAIFGKGDRRFHIYTEDAALFDKWDDYTYAFMYNPFKEICMGMVIEHIRASIMRHPRHFSMIYYNPVLDSQVMASGIFSKRIILSDECLLYTI